VLCNNHPKVNKVKVLLSNFTVSRIIDGANSSTERAFYNRIRAVKVFPTQVDEITGLPALFSSVNYRHVYDAGMRALLCLFIALSV
jgi:hypothetical protein